MVCYARSREGDAVWLQSRPGDPGPKSVLPMNAFCLSLWWWTRPPLTLRTEQKGSSVERPRTPSRTRAVGRTELMKAHQVHALFNFLSECSFPFMTLNGVPALVLRGEKAPLFPGLSSGGWEHIFQILTVLWSLSSRLYNCSKAQTCRDRGEGRHRHSFVHTSLSSRCLSGREESKR